MEQPSQQLLSSKFLSNNALSYIKVRSTAFIIVSRAPPLPHQLAHKSPHPHTFYSHWTRFREGQLNRQVLFCWGAGSFFQDINTSTLRNISLEFIVTRSGAPYLPMIIQRQPFKTASFDDTCHFFSLLPKFPSLGGLTIRLKEFAQPKKKVGMVDENKRQRKLKSTEGAR